MKKRSGLKKWELFTLLGICFVYGTFMFEGSAWGGAGEEYVPGEVLVKVKSDKAEMAQALHAQIGAKVSETLPISKVSRVILPNDVDVLQAVDFYSSNAAVEFAEPNYILHFVDTYPNDPQFSNQWAHENTGQFGGTSNADMNSVAAWDVSTGSDIVVVAITDTGIDLTHPDLDANIWTNPGEDPWADPYDPSTGNGVDDDSNGYVDDWKGYDFGGALPLIALPDNDPTDGVGHGTHVSGIVAAVGNNGTGVAGVSWNAKIMPLKIGPDSGLTLTIFVAGLAIDYAVANGANIINASWGGIAGIVTIKTAIENAHAAGVLFVAAAGNAGTDNDGAIKFYPANYQVENLISVAATDDDDLLADFSNYGRINVDVGAPGVNILATMPTYEVFLNLDPYFYSQDYDYLQGTSMAAPCVAGALAVLMSAHPTETHIQIRDRLFSGVNQVASLDEKTVTGGRINLYNSIMGLYPDLPDGDLDGVPNWTDNCRYDANPGQENADGDAYGAACDCDDSNPNVYPGHPEVAGNGIDDDCDGLIDEGCFIATASFGSEMAGKINLLRIFRDRYLEASEEGRTFVDAYYRYSPAIAEYIAERGWLRTFVRTLLLPVIGLVSLIV